MFTVIITSYGVVYQGESHDKAATAYEVSKAESERQAAAYRHESVELAQDGIPIRRHVGRLEYARLYVTSVPPADAKKMIESA